jgi:hypothetical protein
VSNNFPVSYPQINKNIGICQYCLPSFNNLMVLTLDHDTYVHAAGLEVHAVFMGKNINCLKNTKIMYQNGISEVILRL